ncbi:MAG: nucleotidyltransferase [Alphaproteobacteria bacterium]|nr:nucleotidyltransferase [Alphaproteobacteria bacterium]
MIILMPMAGAGSRFTEKGYTTHKPAILTTDRRSGNKLPMAVCAALDIPGIGETGNKLVFIDRKFHRDDGLEHSFREFFPRAEFITLDRLTEGQASTCLMASAVIDCVEELIIAGCDNGMALDEKAFDVLRAQTDVIVFTYRRHAGVLARPEAHGWVVADEAGTVTRVSVKKPVSDNPIEDHAIVATFWFRHGSDFVSLAKRMIAADDRINGEFYVDQCLHHALETGLRVKAFEIGRYLGWGTPADYENYEKTIDYWRGFCRAEGL